MAVKLGWSFRAQPVRLGLAIPNSIWVGILGVCLNPKKFIDTTKIHRDLIKNEWNWMRTRLMFKINWFLADPKIPSWESPKHGNDRNGGKKVIFLYNLDLDFFMAQVNSFF